MIKQFTYPNIICAFKTKNEKERALSQSGGAFGVIAKYFLNRNAVVYGCSMDGINVLYKRINKIEDIKLLHGAKYVQADLKNVYEQIKNDLDNDIEVLFSGTPCYVAAIKSFFSNHKNVDNLYTVGIICHGVPSPLVYTEYIKYLEKINGITVKKFVFRDKNESGWHSHVEKIIYDFTTWSIRHRSPVSVL